MSTTTRLFIRVSTGLVLLAACGSAQTGTPVSGMEPLDQAMTATLAKWSVPGGALAVVKDGRLVYARGFGLADVEANDAVAPDSLFRIASISKTITAAGILKLVEEGRLDLDARAFDILDTLQPPPGKTMDPRIHDITVRHLLQHRAGWDSSISGDIVIAPPFQHLAAEALGVPSPPEPEVIIRYALGLPLDFDPGTRSAYSNLSYCVLGRIIEKITNERYETYIRDRVLAPAGIYRMFLTRALREQRAQDEVVYYGWPGEPLLPSVFPELPGLVPPQYGAAYAEPLDSMGGWAASAIDIVRFTMALDRPVNPILLPSSMEVVSEKPPLAIPSGNQWWYGAGWIVWPGKAGFDMEKAGGLPGTRSYLLKRAGGVIWAVVFNSGRIYDTDPFLNDAVASIETAVQNVRSWPSSDLFQQYYSDSEPRLAATGVQNAASYINGPVAPGERVVLAGVHLTSPQADSETRQPVRVLFDGVEAETVSAHESRITVVVPPSTAGAESAVLQIERDGSRSPELRLSVAPSAPGIFTFNCSGRGQAAAWHEDGTANNAGVPAVKGTILTLLVTGLNEAEPLAADLGAVHIVDVTSAPYAPGVSAIQFRIPEDAPSGEMVPMTILSGSARSRIGVTVAIQ